MSENVNELEVGVTYVGKVGMTNKCRFLVIGIYPDGDYHIRALQRHRDPEGKWTAAGEEYAYEPSTVRRRKIVRAEPTVIVRPPRPAPRRRPPPPLVTAPPPPPPPHVDATLPLFVTPRPPAPPPRPTRTVLPSAPVVTPKPSPEMLAQAEELRQRMAARQLATQTRITPLPPPPPPPAPAPSELALFDRPPAPRDPSRVPLPSQIPPPPVRRAAGPIFGLPQETAGPSASRPTIPPPPAVTRAQTGPIVRRISRQARDTARAILRKMEMRAGEADAALAAAIRKLEQGGLSPESDSTEALVREVMLSRPTPGQTVRQTVERVAAAEVPSLAALPPAQLDVDPQPRPGETWDVNDNGIVYAVTVEGVRGDLVDVRVVGPGVGVTLPRFFFVRMIEGDSFLDPDTGEAIF